MTTPMDKITPDLRSEIKKHARILMGSTWYSAWKGEKEALLPDQQGCLEVERKLGGTASVPLQSEDPLIYVRSHPPDAMEISRSSEGRKQRKAAPRKYPPTWTNFMPAGLKPAVEEMDVSEGDWHNQVRVGCAKTKGKFRVVTMQGAKTKRLLTPVHAAAYDYISSYGWCVRGQVDSVSLLPVVRDLRPHEKFISGDYEAATDNLNPDAVLAVVEVLAESLPPDLGRVLIQSFTDIHFFVNENGATKRVQITRGSMMGNLCSFVVLCLLNKIVHEMTVDQVARSSGDPTQRDRKVRINGDDIAFCGDDEMFLKWRQTAGLVGFVVNEEKTGRSDVVIELNSQPFLHKWLTVTTNYQEEKSLLTVKKLELGFLRWNFKPDESATALFKLCNSVHFASAARLLANRYIQARLVSKHIPSSCVPRRWRQFLLKKRWFRLAIHHNKEFVEFDEYGRERIIETVDGPPLKEKAEKIGVLKLVLRNMERDARRTAAKTFRGKSCLPRTLDCKLNYSVPGNGYEPAGFFSRGDGVYLSAPKIKVERYYAKRWTRSVLETVQAKIAWVLETDPDKFPLPNKSRWNFEEQVIGKYSCVPPPHRLTSARS